jgi:leader peptidase (prepilin peptidase)/N-methyltransferase
MNVDGGLISVFIFCLGAIVGSFLNVCIVRLPHEKSVVFPSSHCPKCQTPIQWFDNLPLISWLILHGSCRSCKASISFRYWFVELLTGLAFVFLYQFYGLQAVLLPYAVMTCGFIVATFVDFEHRIIPDEVSVGGMFAGIGFSLLIPALHPNGYSDLPLATLIASGVVFLCMLLTWIYPYFCKHLMDGHDPKEDRPVKLLVLASLVLLIMINMCWANLPFSLGSHLVSLGLSLAGFIIGGGMIYAMAMIGDIIFRKESMGGGDVKLLAMIGAFLGWKLAVLTFFIAPFFGAAIGIIEKIRTKDSTIAYGPFLVLGALVSLFWGEWIIACVLTGGIVN